LRDTLRGKLFWAVLEFAAVVVPGVARGQITIDGTLSPARSLAGPNYAITADLGRQLGTNLFHSFGQFNLSTGDSATFSGPNRLLKNRSQSAG
jgi:large exoprotein involved in heme utilization and adhesion